MTKSSWTVEFPGSITVCERDGTILEMNAVSARIHASDGGSALIGKNLMDCHPPQAQAKLAELLKNQQRNVYTIEKNGKKKLIYQSPWYENGEFRGIVELSLEIPEDIPHFVRS